ncbi:MAG TPA: DUF5686 and carboxypeptidase regulatory-like domain-containing protein [Cyclobacteriaceae bacterium]
MRNYWYVFLLLLPCSPLLGVTLKGKVLDEEGRGLGYAAIYVKNTTVGTSTNAEGDFTIDLNPGTYEIVFQYVGYTKKVVQIKITQDNEPLVIQLQPEVIVLRSVTVKANENPANRVIRQAIEHRKNHLRAVNAYKCNVYIKGVQRLDKKPGRIFGFTVNVDTGIVYLSESYAELSFAQPDNFKERMISSKVSGSTSAVSFNQASDMDINFYENILYYDGLTERGIVSPIANNAFLFYEYDLVGTFFEGSRLINKIKVTPRRINDPVFTGFIYIIEDTWRIHSLKLLLTKRNKIEFIDSLWINQVYAPAEEDIWMVFNQKLTYNLDLFGFEGKGNFSAVYSDYQIEPNYKITSKYKSVEEKAEKSEIPAAVTANKESVEQKQATEKSESLFPDKKEYFDNEVLRIEEKARDRSNDYWKQIRPIPLTQEEQLDYLLKDSLKLIRESKQYKDSLDRRSNKISLANILYSGYSYRNTYQEKQFSFDPLINILQYNTVEGLVTNLRMIYSKSKDNLAHYRIIPTLRYGFSNDKLNGELRGIYYYDRHKLAELEVAFGRFIAQFNELNPISAWVNTHETLVNRSNFLKLYQKDYFKVLHTFELTNGLLLTSALEYANRRELTNTSDFSFFYRDSRAFRSNQPAHEELESTAFEDHQVLKIDLELRIRFDQKYITWPDRKIIYKTDKPTIFVRLSNGMDILGTDVSYVRLEGRINDEFNFGLAGEGKAAFSGGFFPQQGNLEFMDFKHFNGNRSILASLRVENFQLLDYYRFSTRGRYFTGHYEHHFNGFIINKFPLLRKTGVQAVGSFHFLSNQLLDSYFEIGAGIEHIFKLLRVDYFFSFRDGKPSRTGVRVGFGF